MYRLDPFRIFVMAVERVERRLKAVTAALNAAGIRCAAVGGNAIAYGVAKANPSATQTIKNVDLSVNQSDADAITTVLCGIGFARENLRGLVRFRDPGGTARSLTVTALQPIQILDHMDFEIGGHRGKLSASHGNC